MNNRQPSAIQIEVERQSDQTPETVLHVAGALDGVTYRDLIDTADALYAAGERNIVVDLENVSSVSSAGLVALHHIATVLEDKAPPDPEAGWEAFHAIARQREKPSQRRLKLRFPQPDIHDLLQSTGLTTFVDIDGKQS